MLVGQRIYIQISPLNYNLQAIGKLLRALGYCQSISQVFDRAKGCRTFGQLQDVRVKDHLLVKIRHFLIKERKV